jgi:hypothetical protein
MTINNTGLDNIIEQSKNIQLAIALAKLNLGLVTELTEKYVRRELNDEQVNSIKKALKDAFDFYTSIGLFPTQSNDNLQNKDNNIEANDSRDSNNSTAN